MNFNNQSFQNSNLGSSRLCFKNQAFVVDFDAFTTNPIAPLEIVEISDSSSNPTNVAEVSFNNLRIGDRVWLNGLFHVDNDNVSPRELSIRIFKNVVIPGQEIYRALIEIDRINSDDFGQPIPVQAVDTISENSTDVTYIVTVSANDDNLFLNGPVTLTGLVIR
jgi:hypothetical protein